MTWMNEAEIDVALQILERHKPELVPYARYLADYRDAINNVSDGWPYWRAGTKPADKLSELVKQAADKAHGFGKWDAAYPSEAEFKKALSPIRAFCTKSAAKLKDFKAPEFRPVGWKPDYVVLARNQKLIQQFSVGDVAKGFRSTHDTRGKESLHLVLDSALALNVISVQGKNWSITPTVDGFKVAAFDSAVELIDPANAGTDLGVANTVEEAFDAVLADAGLREDASPKP